ncbi:hypothetical protein VTK73DRAFT_6189 [Phialemonium thermophilum]|uniref:Uncharacterized protein n=1 Tax=Phialemonium thermophilum TaxID=223376 RepID=A0ABR3WKS0_9PEZI
MPPSHDTETSAGTAKRVIEPGESHLNEQGLPDETSRVHGLPLPDDDAWIRNKPWGLLGEWQTTTEYIKPRRGGGINVAA